MDDAFARADVIVENDYETPAQEHAYLQPEAGICYIDEEGRITVVVAGQWTHEDQEQIAHALNLPLDKIRVIYPAIGGAFGGREDMSVQIILALAVWRLQQRGINRPVKIIWSREESIIGHHKRHAFHIHSKWGATKMAKSLQQKLNSFRMAAVMLIPPPRFLGNATLLCTGPYEIPNVKVDSYSVYTNNMVTGAFRGFGGPQAAFSAELQISKLAEALQLDPVEIRMRNIFHENSMLSVGTTLPKGVTIEKVLTRCAEKAGWQKGKEGWFRNHEGNYRITEQPSYLRRGQGIACGYKNVGFSFGAPEQCMATIELTGKDRDRKSDFVSCRGRCRTGRTYRVCTNGCRCT